jgi:hydroxymethylbilane synthase
MDGRPPSRLLQMNADLPALLRIGTRGSMLALAQADAVEGALRIAIVGCNTERNIIRTTGDLRTDVPLAEVAKVEGVFDKGVFIKELEQALDERSIDIAVHSLKDLPTTLDPRFRLAAVMERAPVRDVLVSRDGAGIAELAPGARVGTSSVRREREILHLRPDVRVGDLRGNVPTRLSRLDADEAWDAILLAEAGLLRLGLLAKECPPGGGPETLLGYPRLLARRLDEDQFLPAAGQGAIALEVRADDEASLRCAMSINHEPTWRRITAEREFLRLLDGGCHTPVGVFSLIEGDCLHMKARVFPESAGAPQSGSAVGIDPLATALALFKSLR